MRAAVCRSFGAPLTIEDLVLDPPRVGEVRVTMKATAVCGSDVHAARGAWGGELPVVLGHEAAGVIAEIGPGVDDLRVGDHVVVSLLRACRTCFYCRRGQSQLCEHDWTLRREHRIRTPEGNIVHQGISVGGFADEVVVHAEQCAVVPDSLPYDSASLLACGVLTGYGAATNTIELAPGDAVAVIGAGGVGLNTIQAAAAEAAAPIIALDVAAEKLSTALRFGATHAFDASLATLDQNLASLTGGRGPDVAFVTVGSPRAMEQAVDLVRPGGTVVVVGIGASNTHARVEIGEFASEERKIIGSKMGSSDLRRDVADLVARYEAGDLLLDELVTGRFRLEAINQAIAGVGVGSTIRNVVVFE